MSCEGGCHAPGCRLDQVTTVLVGGYDQCETSASSFDDRTSAMRAPECHDESIRANALLGSRGQLGSPGTIIQSYLHAPAAGVLRRATPRACAPLAVRRARVASPPATPRRESPR